MKILRLFIQNCSKEKKEIQLVCEKSKSSRDSCEIARKVNFHKILEIRLRPARKLKFHEKTKNYLLFRYAYLPAKNYATNHGKADHMVASDWLSSFCLYKSDTKSGK